MAFNVSKYWRTKIFEVYIELLEMFNYVIISVDLLLCYITWKIIVEISKI